MIEKFTKHVCHNCGDDNLTPRFKCCATCRAVWRNARAHRRKTVPRDVAIKLAAALEEMIKVHGYIDGREIHNRVLDAARVALAKAKEII